MRERKIARDKKVVDVLATLDVDGQWLVRVRPGGTGVAGWSSSTSTVTSRQNVPGAARELSSLIWNLNEHKVVVNSVTYARGEGVRTLNV